MILYGILGLMIGLCVISISGDYSAIKLLNSFLKGIAISPEKANAIDSFRNNIVLIYLCILPVMLIVFMIWINLSNKNLDHFGFKKKYSSAYAVGCFFIPFVNLVEGYNVVSEIWSGTTNGRKPVLIRVWWFFTIFSFIIERLFLKTSADSSNIPQVISQIEKSVFSNVLTIIYLILTILVIRSIYREQHNRNNEVAAVQTAVLANNAR